MTPDEAVAAMDRTPVVYDECFVMVERSDLRALIEAGMAMAEEFRENEALCSIEDCPNKVALGAWDRALKEATE